MSVEVVPSGKSHSRDTISPSESVDLSVKVTVVPMLIIWGE
jgi:hypothetical protein